MKRAAMFLIAGRILLLSTTALGANAIEVKDFANGDDVTLSGTVEDFTGKHFTLRDSTGTVRVDLNESKPIVLKAGEKITVTGVIDRGIFGTDIAAHKISEDKGVGEKIGEAIDSVTGQDAAGSAQSVKIQSLPESGYVKIDGTVDDVSDAKKFTLKDTTGHVDVAITSSQSASLRKGTEVTVIGYVNKGMLGKSINATEVNVRTGTAPVASQTP